MNIYGDVVTVAGARKSCGDGSTEESSHRHVKTARAHAKLMKTWRREWDSTNG
jgi:hypothetical protein